MTPLQIETAARRTYNAVSDGFWSQDEIMNLIWHAQSELALEGDLIERTFETTTTSGTQEYAYPTNAYAIRRVTYNGERVEPYSFEEDDDYTLFDSDTTETGTPRFFIPFNETIIFRPIPDSAVTLKIRAYCDAQAVTTTSSLEVPTVFHKFIIAYVLKEMVSKDQNAPFHDRYALQWERALAKAAQFKSKTKRKAGFRTVQVKNGNERMTITRWRI